MTRSQIAVLIVLFLLVGTLYWPVSQFESVNFDDAPYIYQNPMINQGLTPASVSRAFSGFYLFGLDKTGYWAPVAALSHMIDFELFGPNAGAHHVINVLIHAINCCLVLTLLWHISGSSLHGLLVAVVFAVHPVNVESVAWIVERKGLLSTTFGLFGLLCYLQSRERKTPAPYLASLLSFALAAMAKITAVHFALLAAILELHAQGANRQPYLSRELAVRFASRLWPFFGLAILLGIQAIVFMSGMKTLQGLESLSLFERLGRSGFQYLLMVYRFFCPSDLAVFYPAVPIPVPQMLLGSAFVVLTTIVAWKMRSTRPLLLFGWVWFLAANLPTIGIIQAGAQSGADRYFYVPSIGLTLAVVALLQGVYDQLKARMGLMTKGFASTVVIAFLSFLTLKASAQLQVWRNGETLFRHASQVNPNNYVALVNYGCFLVKKNLSEEAIQYFKKALKIKPDYELAYKNLAKSYLIENNEGAAISILSKCLEEVPGSSDARNLLGVLKCDQGKFEEALKLLSEATELNPKHDLAWYNLGRAYKSLGNQPQAMVAYRQAIEINDKFSDAYFNLGNIHKENERWKEAAEMYSKALVNNPVMGEAFNNLGVCLAKLGQYHRAIEAYDSALQLQFNVPDVLVNKGISYLRLGEADEAERCFEKVLELHPKHSSAILGKREAARLKMPPGVVH
jgi:protein O-mannosyl-transferase